MDRDRCGADGVVLVVVAEPVTVDVAPAGTCSTTLMPVRELGP